MHLVSDECDVSEWCSETFRVEVVEGEFDY